jgi:hypothetical protein
MAPASGQGRMMEESVWGWLLSQSQAYNRKPIDR